jgi:para-nitrobenzyl esterase
MTTPLSKGLFRRAIGQSGHVSLAGDPLKLPQAEKRGEALAAGWKLPPRPSAEDLRAIPAAEICKAQPDYFRSPPPNLGITIDGYVVRRKPAEVFAAGQEHRVSLMLGSNSREQGAQSTPLAGLSKVIEDVYGPLAARAHAMYDGPTDPIYGTPADQWDTDTSYRCGTVAQLMWHTGAGNLAFQYEFARTPVGREAVGSTHATELSYVFATFQHGIWGLGPPARATAVDFQLSDVVQRYWTNFAKTGNPNGGKLPKWPEFDVTTRAYIQFTDAGPIAKEGLRRPFCDVFMQNLQNSKRQPERR